MRVRRLLGLVVTFAGAGVLGYGVVSVIRVIAGG